jgi:hypothetical protein
LRSTYVKHRIRPVVILAVGMLLVACAGEIPSPVGVAATNAASPDPAALAPSASPDTTASSTSSSNPRGRLELLGRVWFQTSATIEYRTAHRIPGQAISPHQCLRQMVGETVDRRQTALRTCLRDGAITLAWDPPGRWRMDVSSTDGTFTLIRTRTASYLCRDVDGGAAGCAVRSLIEVENGTLFRFILMRPRQVLDEIGARVEGAVTQTSARTIAGLFADCFVAVGKEKQEIDRVEWCYSGRGILLFFSTATREGGSTTLEASAVTTEVSDAQFVPPSG